MLEKNLLSCLHKLAWISWRHSGCLMAEVGKMKWCIKLKLVIKTLVFLSTYKTIGNINLTLPHTFMHYFFN